MKATFGQRCHRMYCAPLLAGFCVQRRSGINLILPIRGRKRTPSKEVRAPDESERDRLTLQITIIVGDESTAQSPDIAPTT